MARRRKKGGRRRRKISIFAAAGFIAGLKNLWDGYQSGGTAQVMINLTGYNVASGTFNWRWATAGIPMLMGAAGSMVAAKTGLNRYLNIPWFKL